MCISITDFMHSTHWYWWLWLNANGAPGVSLGASLPESLSQYSGGGRLYLYNYVWRPNYLCLEGLNTGSDHESALG